MPKKIVIIGAGIGGLSAGCYARMNGFEAEIFESHTRAGGLCTSWKRGNYTFDGCIHWLTGSSPADSFHDLWQELGAIGKQTIYNHELFQAYRDADGREFRISSNVDELEKHMLDLTPQDEGSIRRLCRLVRKFTHFDFPQTKAYELFSLFDTMKMIWKFIPFMKEYNFCNNTTVGEFAGSFKDPLIREVLPRIFGGPEISLLSLVITLALMNKKDGGYPLGGSLEFAKNIEKRFLDLGGIIHYRKKVEKIMTSQGKATGILIKDGGEIMADYIVSASDLQSTLGKLLEGKYRSPVHEELLEKVPVFPTSIQVSFGVKMDLSGGHDAITFSRKMPEPFIIGNEQHQWLVELNYAHDPNMAPKGSTVLICFLQMKDNTFWENLYADRKAYKEEKRKILETVTDQFEKIYPGFRDNIEESDVATPMTYVRYTGNRKGAYMSWLLVGKNAQKYQVIPKRVPGLENLWLAGMWVMAPGGLPTGAKTGHDVIQMICRKERIRFRTDKV